jgi:hypothetical protein
MNMKNVNTNSVGRNKTVRAIARTGVSGERPSGMLIDIILEALR